MIAVHVTPFFSRPIEHLDASNGRRQWQNENTLTESGRLSFAPVFDQGSRKSQRWFHQITISFKICASIECSSNTVDQWSLCGNLINFFHFRQGIDAVPLRFWPAIWIALLAFQAVRGHPLPSLCESQGLIIFALACRKECLEFATLLNVIETKNTKACRVELTFALPQFVKLMYIIHHAFTAIKKSHVDCSGLAVQGANFCRRGCLNFCRSCHQGLHHINYLCYDMFLWMLNPGTSWSALWIISNILFVGLRWGVTCQL